MRTFRIKAADWPTQVRPNVAPTANKVTGFGVEPEPPGRLSPCCHDLYAVPCLTQVVTKWIRDTLPNDAAFRYGSIQVNYNYRARKHIDSNNLGPRILSHWVASRAASSGPEIGCVWIVARSGASSMGTRSTPRAHAGKDRFSFILFTPYRYNKLTKSICEEAKRLGVTACSTAGVDDKYFSQYRDLAAVDEDDHVAFTEKHHENNPPSFGSGALSVETNGYAAGRGWGWIAWQTGKSGGDKVHTEHFRKNATGIHVVELDVVPPSSKTSPDVLRQRGP